MFEVIVSNRARKSAKSVPREIRVKIAEILDILENEPIPVEKYDVKKMKGLPNTYRIRIGGYRMVYKVDFKDKLIVIVKIDTREKVYKKINGSVV